ncbi:MAG TPA: hypothetical protein DDZ88_06275 [Verrucomicrobiales bacterium]|nr:hypothetical protein [Verrucomicrobiales bacterium]
MGERAEKTSISHVPISDYFRGLAAKTLLKPLRRDKVDPMNPEQLQQLKTLVEDAEDLPEEAKLRLLRLISQEEQSVFSDKNAPQDSESSFMTSVKEFEVSHPEATSFLNRVATILANMGI